MTGKIMIYVAIGIIAYLLITNVGASKVKPTPNSVIVSCSDPSSNFQSTDGTCWFVPAN